MAVKSRQAIRTGRVTVSQALRLARRFGVTLDLSNDIELAGHWKHGWIPLDAVAAAVKAKRYKGGDGREVRGKGRGGSLVESMRRPSVGRTKVKVGQPDRRPSARWRPANNGSGKRMHFLISSDESLPVDKRYHYGSDGRLVRFASHEAAQRAADRLHAKGHFPGMAPSGEPAVRRSQQVAQDRHRRLENARVAKDEAAGVKHEMPTVQRTPRGLRAKYDAATDPAQKARLAQEIARSKKRAGDKIMWGGIALHHRHEADRKAK